MCFIIVFFLWLVASSSVAFFAPLSSSSSTTTTEAKLISDCLWIAKVFVFCVLCRAFGEMRERERKNKISSSEEEKDEKNPVSSQFRIYLYCISWNQNTEVSVHHRHTKKNVWNNQLFTWNKLSSYLLKSQFGRPKSFSIHHHHHFDDFNCVCVCL